MSLMSLPQFALSQNSGITQFEDKAEWQNASANIISIRFDGIGAAGADIDSGYPGGLSISGVKFSALPGQRVSNYLFVRQAVPNFLYGAGDTDLGCQQVHGPCGSRAGISVSLPPGTTAIGLDLGAIWVPGVIVTFSDNEVFSVPSAPASQQNSAFAGFISSTPLQSVKVQAAGGGGGAHRELNLTSQQSCHGPDTALWEPRCASSSPDSALHLFDA